LACIFAASAVRGEDRCDRREAGPEEERGARVVLQPAAKAEEDEVRGAALTARRRHGVVGRGPLPPLAPPRQHPLPADVGRDGGGRRRGRLRAPAELSECASAKTKPVRGETLKILF